MKTLAKMIVTLILLLMIVGCEEGFAIKAVSPATGVLGGGEPVEIQGRGFNPNMGTTVYFGTSRAGSVVVRPDKLIVTTPSVDEPTVVDVRIATDDGKEFLLKDAFRYVPKSSMDIRDLGERKSMRNRQ